jgi:arginyl-tRNA synthetase
MNILNTFENYLKDEIVRIYSDLKGDDFSINLELSPESQEGDFGFGCFHLAKFLRKNPSDIAENISKNISLPQYIERIIQKNSYLNFVFKRDFLFKETVLEILENGAFYGDSKWGKDKRILIEFSSPNTNKPQHLGHIRNNVLGMSLSNLLKKVGSNATKINLINDRGIHICKSMLAYKKWGDEKTPENTGKKGDHFVGDYYVMFEKEAKRDEKLIEKAQEMLKKWEEGDEEIIKLWKMMNNWVYDGFQKTYNRLGISFDKLYYESETYKLGKDIVLKALNDSICYKNEKGDIIIDLSDKGFGKKVLLRGDGTSIYITQDIGNAKLRFDEYDINTSIYVVASEQNYHFQVLFEVLKRFGFKWADQCYHLSYGMVYLPEGKMKSREGTVVDADELMDELKELAKSEIEKRAREIEGEELEEISEIIGLSALKFFMLKVHPSKDIFFNPEESISFDGDTGPYIQYTHARISSLLRKSEEYKNDFPEFTKLGNEEEIKIIKHLLLFPKVLISSSVSYNPSGLATYLLELAKSFNKFYHDHSVLNTGDKELTLDRVALSKACGIVLKEGLRILGIVAPEKM